MSRLEFPWDLEVLVLSFLELLLLPLHHAVFVAHLSTPLDQVALLQLPPPTPAGNSVPARIGVNALCIQGREPLRSASCLLGFIANS